MRARYYQPSRDDSVLCDLCPHRCLIMPGRSGTCRVRTNRQGVLYADTWGHLSATHFDPVEKKPLYHFHPGSEILSLGSLGCNFKCACCQNYEISQSGIKGFPRLLEMNVAEVIKKANSNPANIGIAYTYNEPFVWYEYMFDIAEKAHSEGLKNVVVSNGYVNSEPLLALLPFIDAFNIDLKAFDAKSYKAFSGGELPFVMHTLSEIKRAGKHLEITMLVVPGLNDSLSRFEAMIEWITTHLGRQVPLHLSRYFPQYKMNEPPTPVNTLVTMAERAMEKLDFVYMGNVAGSEYQQTRCPECGQVILDRRGYTVHNLGMGRNGKCNSCGLGIINTA